MDSPNLRRMSGIFEVTVHLASKIPDIRRKLTVGVSETQQTV
jgi:hypothetical protein